MRRSRRRELIAALFMLLAATLVFGATAATADETEPTPERFAEIDLSTMPEGTPSEALRAVPEEDGYARIIVEVAGDSVAERVAEADGDVPDAQLAATRSRLTAQHRRIIAAIEALGGEVLYDYKNAYNGIAARVPSDMLARLEAVRDVVELHSVGIVEPHNVTGAEYVGAPAVWQDTGRTGRGVKVGIIDSGIDYTHADFGGPGTEAAYTANDRTFVEPGTFPTAKVAGGYDFVGDTYTASPTAQQRAENPSITRPLPDPDPLDCDGHGTHVAGTAAGFGVLSDGSTYRGPYNATTHSANRFLVGPGVAPEATLYAYKVFACPAGSVSTDVLIAAMERAFLDGVDIINMSLGASFGRADAPQSLTVETIAQAGTVIVASAGNASASPFVTGRPATANRAISVAALDARVTLGGANFSLSTGQTVPATLSNVAVVPETLTVPVKVLRNPDGSVSLGCRQDDYVDVAGKLVVTLRGVCARVARAIYGQKAGAAAVAMIDTSANYPPFEGEITENPDTGEKFTVTIPFFGIRGLIGPSPTDDGDRLVAADGGSVTIAPAQVTNPGGQRFATFTSAGPRNVDNALKPDVTAPGVSVESAAVGTGFRPRILSGTSMAAPMATGVAALVNQAHPDWTTEQIKAAIMNTAEAGSSKIVGYDPRRAGAGVADAQRAVNTAVLALAGEGQSSLSYGYEPLSGPYSETLSFTLHNTTASTVSYTLSPDIVGSPLGATVAVNPTTVTVPARGSASVNVTISMDAAAVAALPPAVASNAGVLRHSVTGAILAAPTTSGPGIYTLRVPFLLVPRGLSNVTAGPLGPLSGTTGQLTATLPVRNTGLHSGRAEVFAWGVQDERDVGSGRIREPRGRLSDPHPEDTMDVRAAGVQVLPASAICGTSTTGHCGRPNNAALVFAVNMWGRWGNPSVSSIAVEIDLNGDDQWDFHVDGIDLGIVQGGGDRGLFVSNIHDRRPGAQGNIATLGAEAPMNGSTMLLPALASHIGLSTAGPATFSYRVVSSDLYHRGQYDETEWSTFRIDRPPVSTGQSAALAPGASANIDLTVDTATLPGIDVYGWMVVSHDDPNGPPQADLIPLGELAPR